MYPCATSGGKGQPFGGGICVHEDNVVSGQRMLEQVCPGGGVNDDSEHRWTIERHTFVQRGIRGFTQVEKHRGRPKKTLDLTENGADRL